MACGSLIRPGIKPLLPAVETLTARVVLNHYKVYGLVMPSIFPLWCNRAPEITQLAKAEILYPSSNNAPFSSPSAAAKSLQSCPTLCYPRDGSPPGSPVPGILQARTLEWVAISFSNAGKWKVKVKSPSHVWLLVTPWTAAYEAPPSMGFSRQEYWSGVPPLCILFHESWLL